MAEEPSVEEAVVPSEESRPETEQPVVEETKTSVEPVDEAGVPLKNRQAEAVRKARQTEKAEKELLAPSQELTGSQDEAIKLVEQIAEAKIMKRLEPVLAKQFLMENPDAAEMIEDINRVRSSYPELSSIDKLDIAYKIAKAERQDELIRKGVEAENAKRDETLTKATQASAEGTGRAKAPADTMQQRIASAGTLKELQEVEAMLTR